MSDIEVRKVALEQAVLSWNEVPIGGSFKTQAIVDTAEAFMVFLLRQDNSGMKNANPDIPAPGPGKKKTTGISPIETTP